MLFRRIICTNYEDNTATDCNKASTFRAVNYAKPAQFVQSYIRRMTWSPHQFRFSFRLGQVGKQSPFLRSSYSKLQNDIFFMRYL